MLIYAYTQSLLMATCVAEFTRGVMSLDTAGTNQRDIKHRWGASLETLCSAYSVIGYGVYSCGLGTGIYACHRGDDLYPCFAVINADLLGYYQARLV
jgi:hypothetical protein